MLFFIPICTTFYKLLLWSWMEHLEWGNRNISVVDLRIYLICFSVQYEARKILLFRVSGIRFFTLLSQDLDFCSSSTYNSLLILLSIRAIQNLYLLTTYTITCADPLWLCDTKQAFFPAFFLLLELHQTYDAIRGQSWTFPNDYTENQ